MTPSDDDKDIYGDGHGFRKWPPRRLQRLPVTDNDMAGTYWVEIYDFEGRRLHYHPCDGSYDVRTQAIAAVARACGDVTVGYIEFVNQCKPSREPAFDYDLSHAPRDSTRILGLYKLETPGTYHTRMIWLAKEPTAGLRYLTDEGSEAPYYIQDPIAWAGTPRP